MSAKWKFSVVAACCLAAFCVSFPVGAYEYCCQEVTCCECGECDGVPQLICERESLWDFGGWIEAGIMANGHGQKDAYNANGLDPNSGNTGHLKNVKHASFQANQIWVFLEKKRDRSRFDIGGRIEFMYGVDGQHFQAVGLDQSTSGKRWGEGDYYAALPQMYVELGCGNLSVKIGKFFTVMGLDSSCAPNRFFYSTSFENQTYIDFGGVLATWDVSEDFSVFGGWVNGEGRFFTDGDHNAFLGGFSYALSERVKLDYSLLIGSDSGQREYFVNSLVVRINLSERWDYAFAWLLRNEKGKINPDEHWGRYGINQELFYTVSACWKLGVGVEWLRHYDNRADSYDVCSLRLGANWKPNAWLLIRPEIRYDICDGISPFNLAKSHGTDPKDGQFLYGFSGIITF